MLLDIGIILTYRQVNIGFAYSMVPLIGQLSNGHFWSNLDSISADRDATIPVRVRQELCRCGCQQPVVAGRKFVNQEHYDRSKGLSEEVAMQVLARLKSGESAKKLAREYKVAHTTVYRLFRKNA